MIEADRDALFGRLANEYLDRLQGGDDPTIEEYLVAHPIVADLIREGFPLLHALHPASLTHSATMPTRLGEFRVIRTIGRGGMGIVYEAIQEPLGRRVALKVLSPAIATDSSAVERFKREAQIAGALHHTNIVPVFAVGSHDGIPYYAMQFIDGHSLERLGADGATPGPLADTTQARPTVSTDTPVRRGPHAGSDDTPHASAIIATDDHRAIAELALQAAEALAHAHKQGVLHRDVKPSNLLLDSRGNVWITDFGLARIGEGSDLTASGAVVGTLRYMAPERFRGECDARSDIYSLGATLYEWLSHRSLFDGAVGAELIERATCGRLPSLCQIDRRIPRDLGTIVRTAMAPTPADRYDSAEDLAEDLRRFVADRPIRARRILWAERSARWCRRNPALASMASFAAVCLVAGLLVVLWERSRYAEARADNERRARQVLEIEHYYQTITLADRERASGNTGRAEQLLESCPQELRRWEWYYSRRARYQASPPLPHSSHLYALAVSPRRGRLAVGGSDGSLTVWNTSTNASARLQDAHTDHVRGIAFDPDGQCFASAGWDGFVRVWSTNGNRCLWEKRVGVNAFSVAFHPRDRVVAASFLTADRSGYRIVLWNADTGEPLQELTGHPTVVRRIRFSPDGSLLVSADDAGWVKVWDLASGTERATFQAHPFMIFDLAFSSDGNRLVTAAGQFFMHGENGEVKIWETNGWQEVTAIRAKSGAFYSVALSPDGNRLATGGEDSLVRIWDVASGRETISLRGHKDAVWGVEFSLNGWELYSASGDRDVRHWDARPVSDGEETERNALLGHEARVTGLAYHPREPILVSTDMLGSVRVWDAKRGALIRRLPDLPGQAHCAAFSRDGRRLAVALWRPWNALAHYGIVVLFDTDSWKEVTRFPLDRVGVLSVAFSPDGLHLAAACDFDVAVVRADTGERVWRIERKKLVTAVSFLTDGSLAAGDADGAIILYQGSTGAVLRTLPSHSGRVTALVCSGNGRRFASAGVDGSVRVWDTTIWKELRRPRELVGGCYGIALNHDGGRLISGGTEGNIRVWDLENDREAGSFCAHSDTIHAVAISADGRSVSSAGRDRIIRLWSLATIVKDAGQR